MGCLRHSLHDLLKAPRSKSATNPYLALLAFPRNQVRYFGYRFNLSRAKSTGADLRKLYTLSSLMHEYLNCKHRALRNRDQVLAS